MKKLPFIGAATAVVTPMKDGKIDFDSFSRLIEAQIAGGISAVVICGTTGDSATLTESEKLSLYKSATQTANKRIKVLAGCGSPSTDFTVSLVTKAEKLGVDGILTVSPYYNKGTAEGLYLHYKSVANATSLPVIAYNVPSRTGVDIPLETYEKLTDVPNLIGIKEASGNIARTEMIISRFGNRYAIYSGNDDLISPTYAVGGRGVISVVSNVMPRETAELCRLCERGDMKSAARLQIYLYPLVKALFSQVNPIPVKTALSLMGICSDEMRLPLSPMNKTEKKALADILKPYGLIG